MFPDLFAVLHRDHDGVHPDGDGGASVKVVLASDLGKNELYHSNMGKENYTI